jgi:hypothetical protein
MLNPFSGQLVLVWGMHISPRGQRAKWCIKPTAVCFCSEKQPGKVNFREKEKQVLDQILGPGRYDARIRPSGINGTGEWRFCLGCSAASNNVYVYIFAPNWSDTSSLDSRCRILSI